MKIELNCELNEIQAIIDAAAKSVGATQLLLIKDGRLVKVSELAPGDTVDARPYSVGK